MSVRGTLGQAGGYLAWMEDLPDLSEEAACFFDFDGTLVEIAAHPDAIVVPTDLATVLRQLELALGGGVAVVTGRRLADVDRFLAPLELPTAGAHGAERRTGAGDRAASAIADLRAAVALLRDWVAAHPGSWLEEKPGVLAVHYRGVDRLEDAVRSAVASAQQAVGPGAATIVAGKKVVELRSSTVDKARAVRSFLAEAPFRGRRPWFFGDDAADEPAFAAVEALGGVSVKVGPGDTGASHRMSGPGALRDWLRAQLAHLARPGVR